MVWFCVKSEEKGGGFLRGAVEEQLAFQKRKRGEFESGGGEDLKGQLRFGRWL